MNDPEILSRFEAAALLDCEVTTIEEAARNRQLPGLKQGKHWIFPRQAFIHQINVMAMRGVGEPKASTTPLAVAMANAKKGPPVLPALTF